MQNGRAYTFGSIRIGAELFNLFDAQDADITYFYESQLPSETASVADRHFHPVEPRQVRILARWSFWEPNRSTSGIQYASLGNKMADPARGHPIIRFWLMVCDRHPGSV